VTVPLAQAMNQTCAPVPPEVSEFELARHRARRAVRPRCRTPRP
jgi:hypothetical protein